jgi:hypothetical protein
VAEIESLKGFSNREGEGETVRLVAVGGVWEYEHRPRGGKRGGLIKRYNGYGV